MIKFVNRKRERLLLKEKFDTNKKNIIIIHGDTCIGKSALTEVILKSYDKKPTFKVVIRKNDNISPGFYLYKIACALCEPLNNINLSYTYAKKDLIKINTLKKMPYILLKSVLEASSAGQIFNKTTDMIEQEYDKIKEILDNYNNKSNIKIIENAILMMLKDDDFVLNIENFQSIDEESLCALIRILSQLNTYNLLIEETDNVGELTISDIAEFFENEADAKKSVTEIKKLEKNNVLEMINQEDYISRKEVLNLLESEWDGNIKDIKDIIIKNKYSLPQNEDIIDTLSPEELYWLTVIVLDNNTLSLQDLLSLKCPKKIIRLLKEKELILEKNDIFLIEHDTIIDKLLNNTTFKTLRNDIYNLLFDFHYKIFISKKTYDDYLKSLKFSIELGKNDTLIDLISSGKIMILSSTNAKKYINEIEKHVYKGIVTNSIPDELLFWLIELYQGIRDYKKALIILNNLKGKKNNDNTIDKISAYDAILTYQNGHHEAAIKKCKQELAFTNSKECKLIYLMIQITSYYSMGEKEKAKQMYMNIIKNKKEYLHLFEYGFVLRNSELFNSYYDIINDLEESIAHFSKYGADRQIYSSKNTLAVHYALVGNNQKGIDILKEILKNKDQFLGMEDTLYNNLAVIKMLAGENDGVLDYLSFAKKYADDDYAQLAINNNILAYNNINNKKDYTLINEIESIIKNRTFKSIRIIQFCYINIMLFYKDTNKNAYEEYYSKLKQLGKLEDYMYKWTEGKKVSKKNKDYYRSKLCCPINFLSEWSIEIDNNHMKFKN